MHVKRVEREVLTARGGASGVRLPNDRPYDSRDRSRTVTLRPPVALAAMALVLAALLLRPLPAGATTYKWVDEKGVVHYSDSLPPEAVDRGNVQLNKEGVPIKKIDAAPTPEQRKAVQEEQERQKALAKEREISERRDRALMESYTSEDEIDLSKTRALATIDNQLQSAQMFSASLTKRRAILQEKKGTAGEKLSAAQERELEGIDAELAKQDGLIVQKKKEFDAVTAKYDADKKRWRELKVQADASAAAAAAAAAAASARSAGTASNPPGTPQKSSSRPNGTPAAVAGTAGSK